MIYTRCEPYETNCRFCSKEAMLIPFTKLIENPKTNRLEPAKETMLRKEELGTYCNNVSKWCSELHQCPARLALVKWCGVKAEGTGIYAKLHTDAELREILREIVPGQQVLPV